MKTSGLIRTILLAGTISLTLASCGGGGGGGGEAPSSENNTSSNTPSTQQGYAPYDLSGCTITYVREGYPFTFEFDNSGQVKGGVRLVDSIILYEGTYTYSRSADGMGASLVLHTTSGKTADGIAKEQTFEMKLKFSSYTNAIAEVDYEIGNYVGGNGFAYHDDHYTASVTFSGAGVLENGSFEGESNDGNSTDNNAQLAPDSLPVGKVVNLHANGGSIASYTLNSTTSCTSNAGAKLTWEYSVTGDTTAEWVTSNALNIFVSSTKMVFTSATGGTYTRLNADNNVIDSGSFNLSDKSDAPQKGDNNASDSSSDNQNNVAVSTVPDSLTGYIIDVTSSTGKKERYYITGDNDGYTKHRFTTKGYDSGYQYIFFDSMFYTPNKGNNTAKVTIHTPAQWIGSVHPDPETGGKRGYQQESRVLDGTLYFDANGNIPRIEGTLNFEKLVGSESVGVKVKQ